MAIAPADQGVHGISTPIVTASQLVTRLGAYPTVTVPLRRGRVADAGWLWEYLAEPAEYFGLTMPSLADLTAALDRFTAAVFGSGVPLVAATVSIVDGGSCTVTGSATEIYSPRSVRIGQLDDWTAPSAADAHWLRMAARTTSLGTVDLLLRRLADQGCVDGMAPGPALTPTLAGALVIETAGGLVGLDNPEPVSILGRLQACGPLEPIELAAAVPAADVLRAWWISPQYRTHPVAQLGDHPMDTPSPSDSTHPPFLEQQ
ncbi:MAG: hypothetical protein P4L86_29975 [Mycobacterium sp.]|nr:hypothetical protein [Mycobacterium sp.]